MMAGLLALVWLGVVGLCGHHLTGGHGLAERSSGEQDSAVTACVGQQLLLDKQSAIEQDLRALRQSVTGLGSSRDLLELKNKLIVMGTKLELAEINMQAAETKLEAAETKLDAAETKLEAMEAKLETSVTEVNELRSALEQTASVLQDTQTQVQKRGASTFVRWGRKTCPNRSQLLYSGVAGGSYYAHTGAAANALCLTRDPEFDSTPLPSEYTYIYGAEYQSILNHHQQDAPCSVCCTHHPTTLMIPSTHSCPSGWTTQYTGHLVAGHYTHTAATEFVCLDEEPEDVSGGHTNDNGKLFYYVVYRCGSLPCPPYVNKAVALCVVCSK